MIAAVSKSITWLMEAMTPFFINSLMISTGEIERESDSSLTVRARGNSTLLLVTTLKFASLPAPPGLDRRCLHRVQKVYQPSPVLAADFRLEGGRKTVLLYRRLPALLAVVQVSAPARLLTRRVDLDAPGGCTDDPDQLSLTGGGPAGDAGALG
jgi:hypothetical protein